MKKYILLIIVVFLTATSSWSQKKTVAANSSAVAVCCPEFTLAQDYTPPCRTNCPSDVNGGPIAGEQGVSMMASCRSTHSYTVVPNLTASGYTYLWTIIGGTPTSTTGNPINITWNSGATNVQIKVVINGPEGCNKTIIKNICLVDGPIANILSAAPNPVCAGTPVNFVAANTSTLFYNWDFGDNSSATGQNVSHTYAATAPYFDAVLTVRDTNKEGCGCIDRDTIRIFVNNGNGLQITNASCKKMFCHGDTATFCASNCAGPYTWTVVGGTPASFTGNCVKVTWNASSLVPASVTVSTPNCPAGCGGSATLQVPVLLPNLQINGLQKVCPGSTSNYSLPNMPGAFYSWTLSGGGAIATADSNTSNITINWNSFPSPGGPYNIICNYNNPITGCSGADTIQVLVKPPFTISGFTTPCVGSTFNYSNASITPGPVNWTFTPTHPFSPPNPTPNINVTWAVANTYTILATPVNPLNYCTPSATIAVTVNPKPNITAITPATAVCKGSTHVYAATSTIPNAGTFNWTVTGGIFITLGAHEDSVQITWDNSGVYNISVTQTLNVCQSTPFSQSITVIANPTIAPVTSPVCTDATTTFTAAGGTSYTWTIDNSLGSLASPQGSNPMNVQWNGSFTAGTFPSIVTVANQCGNTASATVNVITPNAFTVTQSGDLCNLTGVILTTSGGSAPFVWTGPSVVGTGSTVSAMAAGLYTVTALDTGGCTVKATINVLPKFLSAVSISSGASKLWYCPGESINVVLTSSFSSSYVGCTYQWYQNGVSMGAGYTSPTLTITSLGVFANNPGNNSFNVVVTCGGCTSTSNVIPVLLLSACPPSTGSCPFASTNFKNRFDDNSLAKNVRRAGGPSEQTFSLPPFGSVTITAPSNGATICGGTGTFTSTYTIAPGTIAAANAYWSFGDGTISSGTQTISGLSTYNNTVTHTYTQCGNYQVIMHVTVQCSTAPDTYCLMTDTINVVVPAVAKFNPTVVCNKVYLQDLSSVCSAACNFNYLWSVVPGAPGPVSFSPATSGSYSTIANTTVMTASIPGSYNITLTLSSASCGCVGPNAVVYSQTVVINLPSATFTALPPVCAGTPINFTTTSVGTSYNWNFYSTYQSNLQPTVHSFPAPPPSSQQVILTVTDANGCVTKDTQNINVLPPITVNITGNLDICLGGSTTLTANTAGVGPTFQWYYNGAMVGTNSSTYNTTTTGQYWVTVSSSSGGCFATSLKVTVKLKQAPIAKIKPVSRICLGGSGGATLQNRINEVNTSYTWSVLFAPTTVSFSPNGTNAAWFTTPTPGTAIAGDYIFVLTALNTISGCEAKDTICIKAYNKPVFTVSGVPGCAGVNNTFTASPAIPYNYLWSNGATGNIMTTSIAGLYDIMATDSTSGCSSDQIGVVLIKPKPNVSLFPLSGCDTLCNKDTLVPPLPLSAGGTYGSNYIINWYDGATLIYTGPYLVLNTLTPNPGQHNIHIVVTFIGSTCASTSGDYNVYIKNCDSCNCDNSSWGEITWQYNDAANKLNTKNANVPKPNSIKCGDKLGAIDCKKPITINAIYNCVGSNCTGAVNYSLTGAVTQSGSLPFTTNGLPQGSYLLTLYGICGTDTCKKCEFPFEIKCDTLPECNCKGSQWGDKTYSIGNISQPIKCMTPRDKPIEVKCKIPISINANYNCADEKCNSAVTYTLVQPSGTTTGNLPLTFTPNQVGIYTITMNGYCGTVLCNTCIIKFKVSQCDTIPPPICCPYNISVKDPIITTNSLASPPATIANANFAIGGPGGNLFTEIRANVISYGLYDNFSNECINCKSYPYSWASMYKPGNVNSIPPAITMFNSTATAFNPSGNGVYQNPREVVWASNAPFALPANINLSFLLPAASIITCCELTAKICVKFTFRDNDCRECEVLVCFTVIIKPGGGSAGGGDSKDCTCDFKPMLNYKGGSKTLQCGDTLTLFQGKIPVSLQPNFTCKDSNGKACNSQPPSVTIKKNYGPATTLVGPLYNYTFLQSGLYQYSMVGLCAGKKCECKFIVKIP